MNWDDCTDSEMFYYVLGQGNHVTWHQGWDWTMIDVDLPRIWMEEVTSDN